MEWATWIIAFFTIILAIATIVYARISWLAYKASQEQSTALKELASAIRDVPKICSSVKDNKEKRNQMAETTAKEQQSKQQRAMGKP